MGCRVQGAGCRVQGAGCRVPAVALLEAFLTGRLLLSRTKGLGFETLNGLGFGGWGWLLGKISAEGIKASAVGVC